MSKSPWMNILPNGSELIRLADVTPGRDWMRSRTPRAKAWMRSGSSARRSGRVTLTVWTMLSRPLDAKPVDTDVRL